jgi:hypothetical protein
MSSELAQLLDEAEGTRLADLLLLAKLGTPEALADYIIEGKLTPLDRRLIAAALIDCLPLFNWPGRPEGEAQGPYYEARRFAVCKYQKFRDEWLAKQQRKRLSKRDRPRLIAEAVRFAEQKYPDQKGNITADEVERLLRRSG